MQVWLVTVDLLLSKESIDERLRDGSGKPGAEGCAAACCEDLKRTARTVAHQGAVADSPDITIAADEF